jgi:hypothetical protein
MGNAFKYNKSATPFGGKGWFGRSVQLAIPFSSAKQKALAKDAGLVKDPVDPTQTPVPPPPETFDPDAVSARDRARRRTQLAYGRGSTITSPTGAVATTQPKTLLGS